MHLDFVSIKRIKDTRGQLIPFESNGSLPFEIKRVYFVFDVPAEVRRGFHAHRKLEQVVVCLRGSFKMLMDDGSEKSIVHLTHESDGLVVGPHMWHEMFDFSPDCLMAVFASDAYNESDYIRDYSDFLSVVNGEKNE